MLANVIALAWAAPVLASPFPAPETARAVVGALGGADLVLFDPPRAGKPPRVFLCTLSRAPAETFRAILSDPAAYRRAVPALRRADVIRERDPASGAARRIAWEIEIPLWNLEGEIRLDVRPHGVLLSLVEGDLAPGSFWIAAVPEPDGTFLWMEAEASVRDANWLARRLATRTPLAEPAMAAAAAYVLLRALVLEAERGGQTPDSRRRPTAPPVPPPLLTLDGAGIGRAALEHVPSALVAAAVRSRPDGRLDRVELAVTSKLSAGAMAAGLADPQRWRALPGWRAIAARPGRPGESRWQVDTRLPFVDFDATWTVTHGSPLRATATAGSTRGAVFGWDVLPIGGGHAAMAVLSWHPRIEKTGYIPRKFIEAEPLLEHGMSLALAYVDAVSLVRALGP